jgi:hypothetical protein
MTQSDSSAPRADGMATPTAPLPEAVSAADGADATRPATPPVKVREIGGRKDGPEPTRFGDWERNGRCVDF